MKKEYFRIMFAQLKLTLDYDSEKEFLVSNDEYFFQMDEAINNIRQNDYDLILFPEVSYHEKYDSYFKSISKNKIIVFGSVYVNKCNYTVVYHNLEKYLIKKQFNCAVEPSVRFQDEITVKEFMKNYLKEHVFTLYGKKFVVLNCAEYYKVAYFIARDEKVSKNLFGFLVPCANNNVKVFLNESIAIHNHNDKVYSFVINSVATYKNKKYSFGESYVFGKVSSYEKECLDILGEYRLKESSNICYLNDESYFVDGMYLCGDVGNYYRSDSFKHTPKNIKIKRIGEKKK